MLSTRSSKRNFIPEKEKIFKHGKKRKDEIKELSMISHRHKNQPSKQKDYLGLHDIEVQLSWCWGLATQTFPSGMI
jgi:hypothetical protein